MASVLGSFDDDGESRSAWGLPTRCSQSDPALFAWALDLVGNTYPDNPTAYWPASFIECDPDSPEPLDTERCLTASGHGRCFYGILAASACVLVMYANHPEVYEDSARKVRDRAYDLYLQLTGSNHALEFYDSSGWAFSTNELAAIASVYRGAILSSSWSGALPLRESSWPWGPSSPSRRADEEAAARSLALVASWSWPPRSLNEHPAAFGRLARAAGAAALRVRLWGFGTHCSVMAEPISAMRRLLSEEFELSVVSRGTADYCGFHRASEDQDVRKDQGSAVREVYDRFRWKELKQTKSHRDALARPDLFLAAFREALDQEGEDFWASDVTLCSEPGLACLALHDAGKPVIGYLGVHIAFMVTGDDDQLSLYRRFRDELAVDPRHTFAAVAPYISMQMYYHTGVEVPAVRPVSLYTAPASYNGAASDWVLINRRPTNFWDLNQILNGFSASGGHNFQFVQISSLPDIGLGSYVVWSVFRAVMYFPYDWLQTMAFYDFINIGLPTFVPDSPMYLCSLGTNAPDEWIASLWEPPEDVFPHHYSATRWLNGTYYWWGLTDFVALPGVSKFASVPDLLQQLSEKEALWRISGELRASLQQRTASASTFWRGALLRALGS